MYEKRTLPNGVRMVYEHMPHVRSAAIGVWIGVGSRYESPCETGSAHFIEHMLFKGTAQHSASELAERMDAIGGQVNAYTTREGTCYYARVLDADLPMAVEVIMDMVTSSLLDPEEFETERGVILEELAMALDDPADLVHERFTETVLAGHPLARPIGGTPETIAALSREAVLAHYRASYVPEELVITAAGNVDHDAVCAAVLAGARAAGWSLPDDAAPAARREATSAVYAPSRTVSVRRPTEQAHVILGGRGLATSDPRRFALGVASTILGGGMSSRLFQEIRERRGLAYSTYSFTSGYAEGGVLGVYAACAPAKVGAVLDVMRAELARLVEEPVADDELARAIGQVGGTFVLASEDTGSRMSRLGLAEIVTGRLISTEETLQRYRSVTAGDIQQVAADLLAEPPSVVLVGPDQSVLD